MGLGNLMRPPDPRAVGVCAMPSICLPMCLCHGILEVNWVSPRSVLHIELEGPLRLCPAGITIFYSNSGGLVSDPDSATMTSASMRLPYLGLDCHF